jgi:hypothetical protein
MLRGILGSIAGLVIGVMIIFAIEMLGHYAYPFPPGLDPHDHQALANFMKTAPLGAWLFVLAAYAAGSFAAGASGHLDREETLDLLGHRGRPDDPGPHRPADDARPGLVLGWSRWPSTSRHPGRAAAWWGGVFTLDPPAPVLFTG